MKRSVKQLSSKTKCSTFSELSCSNFRLKLCEKLHSYQNCSKNEAEWDWGELEAKKVSRDNHGQDTNSGFHVKQRSAKRI